VTKLSIRLQTIADLVEDGSSVIDIGCDHGYLDIYLAKYKNCTCLATDVSKNCLIKAEENIKKCNLQNKIQTKVSNGLQNIDYKSFDYVIIAGMGFKTISQILKNDLPEKIIIQSNNNIEDLKKFLFKNYILLDEKVVFENGFYYVILYLKKGYKKYKYSDYIIGNIRQNKNIEYLNYLYNKYKKIYQNMPKKYLIKRMNLYRKIIVLKRYLKKH